MRPAEPSEIGLGCTSCKSARNIGHPDLWVGLCSNCDAETLFFTCPKDGTRQTLAVSERKFKKIQNLDWTCPKCAIAYPLKDIRTSFGVISATVADVAELSIANQGSTSGKIGAGNETHLAQLHGRLAQGIRESLYESETVEKMYSSSGLSIKNTQAILFTNRRVLIGKSGRDAGMHFGKQVTAFNYAEITNVEFRTGPLTGWIEILSPAFPAILNPHFYSKSEMNDPWKRPNCMPVTLGDKKMAAELVRELRKRIDLAKSKNHEPASSSSADLPDQLAKLADLLAKGVITAEEFSSAKAKLLS